MGNYRDFVGKNKKINITNKKKGKERIVEEVVTGSVREIFGKNEGDRSRNWLNEERKKFCFWIQWVFSTEFQPFFFIRRKLLCSLNNFIRDLGFLYSCTRLSPVEICKIISTIDYYRTMQEWLIISLIDYYSIVQDWLRRNYKSQRR